MKPLNEDQFEALANLMTVSVHEIINDGHAIDYEQSYKKAYALLVNDSEPVMAPYCKADLPAYDGKPVYTYNPETHMLVPRVWSENEEKDICKGYIETTNSISEDILYAITKVFGGEK